MGTGMGVTLHTFVYGLHEGDFEFWYVGMTKDPATRLSRHRGCNPHATPDTQLHVLEEVTGTLDEVRPVEQEWIDGLRAAGYPLVNAEHAPPYKGGRPLGDEHRAKLRKPRSAEARRHISEGQRGRPKSDEHRRKLSEAGRGRKLTDAHRAAISAGLKARKAATA